MITDAVFEFLKHRCDEGKVYIENTCNKYEGVQAVGIRNENNLLNAVRKHCEKSEPFLFGCDSCATVMRYSNKCVSEASAQDKDNYVVITEHC